MTKLKQTLRTLKGCIWGNRFRLSKEERNKFDDILLFVVHNIDFKNEQQKDKFIKDVFEL